MIESEPKSFLCDARRRGWFWDLNDVFESDLSANAMLVRLYLARCANGDRQAWPSLNTISKSCKISKPTVIKALKELEEKGWIDKVIRKRPNQEYDTTIYFIKDPPVTGTTGSGPEGGGGKTDLPPVKNETGEAEGVVKDVYHLVNQFNNLVKQVDSNNTNNKRSVVVDPQPGGEKISDGETESSSVEDDSAAFVLPPADAGTQGSSYQDAETQTEREERSPKEKSPGEPPVWWEMIREKVREVTGADISAGFAREIAKKYPPEKVDAVLDELRRQLGKGIEIRGGGAWLRRALENDFQPDQPVKIAKIFPKSFTGSDFKNNDRTPRTRPRHETNYPLSAEQAERQRKKKEFIRSLYT